MSKLVTEETKSYVMGVLIDKPIARDSDKHLIIAVWCRYLKDKGVPVGKMSFKEFCLEILPLETLPTPGSITRARRELQATESLVRGEKYEERQKKAGKVKQEYAEKASTSLKEQYEAALTDLPKQKGLSF